MIKKLLMATLLTHSGWATPNYSGNWELDRQASQWSREWERRSTSSTIQVRHQNNQLFIRPEQGDLQTYRLNGQPVPFKLSAGGPNGTSLHGCGVRIGGQTCDALGLIEHLRVLTPTGEILMHRQHLWSLTDGDNTLVIESSAQLLCIQQRSRLVFHRRATKSATGGQRTRHTGRTLSGWISLAPRKQLAGALMGLLISGQAFAQQAPTGEPGDPSASSTPSSPPPITSSNTTEEGSKEESAWPVRVNGNYPAPALFEGPGRVDPILPGQRFYEFRSKHWRYQSSLSDTKKLSASLTPGRNIFGLDLDYTWQPDDLDGRMSIFASHVETEDPNFRSGLKSPSVGGAGKQPWLYRNSAGVGYTTEWSENFDLSTSLFYQSTSIHDTRFGAEVSPFDSAGGALTGSGTSSDQTVRLRLSGLYQDLDNEEDPADGTRLRFLAEQAIGLNSSNLSATRFGFNFTQMAKLSESGPTLLFNGQMGTQIGAVPAYEAYTLGGNNSVRGYRLGELGSGRSFALATLELRQPLGSLTLFNTEIPFRLTGFVDYGSLLGSQDQVLGTPGLVREKPGGGFGYGPGLHAITPLGLMRLELGFAANHEASLFFSWGDRF